MIRRVAAVLATAAVLLTAGCGTGSWPAGVTDAAALQFSTETLDGRPFSGESLTGRPAVLWFWAPWCAVCQREAPLVARVARENPAVTFVGVGARDRLPALRSFVTDYGVDAFTELADPDGAVWAKFGVRGQPAYAFVSPDGQIDVVRGSLPEDELTTRVRELTDR